MWQVVKIDFLHQSADAEAPSSTSLYMYRLEELLVGGWVGKGTRRERRRKKPSRHGEGEGGEEAGEA
jgi:hypothetical protein